MKKLLAQIFNILSKLLKLINWFKNRILIYFNATKDYLDQSECEKYKNCILLHKLLAQQPPNSDRYLEYPWMLENIDIII